MTGCYTYRAPELILTKEEEIGSLVNNLRTIKPLLEKFEKLTKTNPENKQDAFNQREYYRDRYSYFYQELLSIMSGNQEKVKLLL